jgi:hypothetical protein
MMEKKLKPLRPLPWEAVEAQHEWLMEQFEQGLNYARQCSRYMEDQLIIPDPPPRYTKQSNFNMREFRFALGGTSLANWVSELRDGNVLPSAPTPAFDIVDVKVSYLNTIHSYRFEVRRNGRVYQMMLDDEDAARLTDAEIRGRVIDYLTEVIRRVENDEVERPRF